MPKGDINRGQGWTTVEDKGFRRGGGGVLKSSIGMTTKKEGDFNMHIMVQVDIQMSFWNKGVEESDEFNELQVSPPYRWGGGQTYTPPPAKKTP